MDQYGYVYRFLNNYSGVTREATSSYVNQKEGELSSFFDYTNIKNNNNDDDENINKLFEKIFPGGFISYTANAHPIPIDLGSDSIHRIAIYLFCQKSDLSGFEKVLLCHLPSYDENLADQIIRKLYKEYPLWRGRIYKDQVALTLDGTVIYSSTSNLISL